MDKAKVPRVMWTIVMDPAGEEDPEKRCKHGSFLCKSHIPEEREFLFAPYSTFQVETLTWGEHGQPHEITLLAMTDNLPYKDRSLPLAPWY